MPPPDAVIQGATGTFASDWAFAARSGAGGGQALEPVRRPSDIDLTLHEDELARQAALEAITAKAAELGGLAGGPTGPLTAVPGGHMRAYAGCDIYFSAATGAHEIHGDIRAKYNARHGVFWLGLPLTDETPTPDDTGRFNHFQHGSIYWAPHTGPMVVTGPIRDVWAREGWERGRLGYPVTDEHRLSGLTTADAPKVAWSVFENGVVVSTSAGTETALAAELTPEQLRTVVRRRFDQEIHRSPENVGLHAPVETLEVSGWSYGFWGSLPRLITLRMHGFRDNGLAPDTEFELDVRLRFGTVAPPSFTEPAHRTVIAALDWIRVRADGLASGDIAQGVLDGVRAAFFRGGADPEHPEVPDGAVFVTSFPTGIDQTGAGRIDVVDVLATSEGGLGVFVNPLPPPAGLLRQRLAQQAIDAFAEG